MKMISIGEIGKKVGDVLIVRDVMELELIFII
jgi:hypothetical protein